ncbi:hypothetical protein CSKR_100529 [Clonorchis sinensis]|uniref:Large ribosomal subunit protein bL17m n=2 Tax=Clonorchis sinensis TaxID=79923 RepID=A0A8T1MX18_CLOSI|nr:hypothetical protein CSKR_100529 [Clonorchis sinensis]
MAPSILSQFSFQLRSRHALLLLNSACGTPRSLYSTRHATGRENQTQNVTPYGSAVTRLRVPVPEKSQRLARGEGIGGGPEGRMFQLRRTLSALFDEERIELAWQEATEARLYAERLIQEAIQSSVEQDNVALVKLWLDAPSDQIVKLKDLPVSFNPAILELAMFWLQKPHLIEKLFKVFVPRYRFYNRAYTSLHRLPRPHYPSPLAANHNGFGILEMHGNPWPSVRGPGYGPNAEPFKDKYLINVLVTAARKAAASRSTTTQQSDHVPPTKPTSVSDS